MLGLKGFSGHGKAGWITILELHLFREYCDFTVDRVLETRTETSYWEEGFGQ